MLVYRYESPDVIDDETGHPAGVYRTRIRADAMFSLARHPGPMDGDAADPIRRWRDTQSTRANAWVFGFPNVPAVRRWCLARYRRTMANRARRKGKLLRLSVYEVSDEHVIANTRQCVFRHAEARLVATLDPVTLAPIYLLPQPSHKED